jgi:uncharacterized protein (UPF0276 family)
VNYDVPFERALASHPLARVRELHVSGGSWAEVSNGASRFRRDTHDAAVPDEVMAMIPRALDACPNVRAVVYERLGGTMQSPREVECFRDEFRTVRAAVKAWSDAFE